MGASTKRDEIIDGREPVRERGVLCLLESPTNVPGCPVCQRRDCECYPGEHVVFSVDDVEKHAAFTPSGQPSYECGWCGAKLARTRSLDKAKVWFAGDGKGVGGHECAVAPLDVGQSVNSIQPWRNTDMPNGNGELEGDFLEWALAQPDPSKAFRDVERARRTARAAMYLDRKETE